MWEIIIYIWAGATIAMAYDQIDLLSQEVKLVNSDRFTRKQLIILAVIWPVVLPMIAMVLLANRYNLGEKEKP